MDKVALAKAFNEWMRRYAEDPEAFERDWQTVQTFLAERSAGKTPTYGEICAAYLEQLLTTV